VRLQSALERHAQHLGDKPAVIDNVGAATYRELDAATNALASWLSGRGVRPGDVVALAVEPTAPGVALMLGVMRLGAIAAPLNTRLAPPEVASYLERVAPVLTLVDPASGVIPDSSHVFTRLDEPGSLVERLELDDAVDRAGPSSSRPGTPVAEEAGSIALPTGGTTGTPKAALWSRRGLSDISISNCIHLGVGRFDRELYISPLFHITIVAGLLPTLYAGGTVRLLGRFDAEQAAALFVDFRPTRMFSTPIAFSRLLQQLPPETVFADREFTLAYGASRNAPGFRSEVRAKLPRARLITGYGATEHGPVVRLYEDDPEAEAVGSVGHPVAGVRIVAVDQEGKPVADGEIGELLVSAPWQIIGYLGTTETPWAADGSVRSGDLGMISPTGAVFLSGRSKEVIKTGGENVYPNEVENVIQQHPLVEDAGVYGMLDDTWGERVEAAIVVRPGAELDATQLRQYCGAHLAGYKVPKLIRFVTSIPYTPNLKLDRRQLQADAGAQP
jgi:fatty-acyl-CoA synthase